MVQPLHDKVVIRIFPMGASTEDQKTAGGIILLPRDNAGGPNPVREAIVIAVGSGEIMYDGSARQLIVREGQKVLVHENECLPLEPQVDPSLPYDAFISERSILAIV